MPSLIVVGRREGEHSLGSDVTVIGRDRGVTLELSDFQVSRRHALVIRTDDGCWVKDLGSRNGVLVNKAKVPTRRQQRLKNGDVLTLGKTALVFKDLDLGPLPEDAAQLIANAAIVNLPAPKADKAEDTGTGEAETGSELVRRDGAEPESKTPESKTPESKAPAVAELEPDAPARPRARFQELAADDDPSAAAGPLLARGDHVAMRQLLRRAEQERVFYRNLTLGLVGFLMLVLVALLFYALGRGERRTDDAGGSARGTRTEKVADGPPAAGGRSEGGRVQRLPGPVSVALGRAGELDAKAFAESVQPLLARTCATSGCHRAGERGAGELVLEGKTDAASLEKDLESVKRFVLPGRPERSPLLTKALRRDEGGEEHGGGEVLSTASPAYRTVRDWIAKAAPRAEDDERPRPRPAFSGSEGETATNNSTPSNPAPAPAASSGPHRPVAAISASGVTGVKVGAPITLDATGSTDAQGCELSYHWALIDRPDRSRAELAGPLAARATLVPDAEGSYLVSLVVKDAQSTSEPARITIECSGAGASAASSSGAAPVAKKTGGPLLKDDPSGRFYVREVSIDLLGRGPTSDETRAALEKSREDFVADVLSKDELYTEWYEQELLYFLLIDNFRPADEVTELPRKLKAKEMTVKDAIHATVIGQYFNQRNPGNDTFVTVVLEQLMGLKVQEKQNKKLLDAGKKMYDGYAATLFTRMGNKQADIVRIVVGERGFAEHLVKRSYRRVTGLDIDKDELAQACDRLEKGWGDFFEVVKGWVLSPRYLDRVSLLRAKTERAFIRTIFVDVLQRVPEEEELRNARNAMRALADPGPLKSVLAKLL
ncbi:MAG: FHA domain-containing protein, partial [Planctomycetota bacterium]